MTMKLRQKRFFKATREFEIVNDVVNVRIKSPFKEEKLTVMLTMLNPDPVVNKSYLDFHSRVKCGPLISLLLNKPNAEEFNAFVDTLKRRALEEYNTFAGIKASSEFAGLAANVYEEPPVFEESDQIRLKNRVEPVDAAKVASSIQMLERYLATEEVKPLLYALEALQTEPQNESYLAQVVNAFNELVSEQGAVLTYAPYVSILLSDNASGND